jgi:hypothetical protein
LNANDTDVLETPARSATSAIVGRLGCSTTRSSIHAAASPRMAPVPSLRVAGSVS